MSYTGRASGTESGWIKSIQTTFSSSWLLFLTVFVGIAFLALLVLGAIAFLSYGFSLNPPGNVRAATISTPTQIVWHENNHATIKTGDIESAITALGVAHASQSTWQMALWRQTATGSLTQWFGSNLLHMDQFTRRLRMAALAQQTYATLPPEHKKLLQAYTEGVNAVLLDRQNIAQDEFALLGIDPTPWEPWHTLAVERLFAWLSVNLPASDSLVNHMPGSYWSVIKARDLDLRLWLQIHSFDHSLAGMWPADTTNGTIMYHRLVHGSSAISVFQEVSIQLSGNEPIHTASLPGTLSLYSGISPSRTWFILPSSQVQIREFPANRDIQVLHERIVNSDNTESLIVLRATPGWLLPEQEVLQDSIPTLFWKGLEEGTDITAFVDLLSGNPPSFSLIDGNGLLTEASEWTLLGSPAEVHPLDDGIVIGNAEWTTYLVSRLNHLLSDPPAASPERWPADCINTWAEEKATFLLYDYLLRRAQFTDPTYTDALTYLRNWDFAYNKSSIGATLFESWLGAMPDSLYNQAVSLELSPSNPLPARLWQQAIDSLGVQFGSDLSQWRLEATTPIYRGYPAWINYPRFAHDQMHLSNTLFAPLTFPGQGHAATLCWGSFVSQQGLTVSSRWDSWAVNTPTSHSYFWRNHETPRSMLGRYRIANKLNAVYHYSASDTPKQVSLLNSKADD